ncbi:hypothetical protein V1264_016843 [Littorina saxatilis]
MTACKLGVTIVRYRVDAPTDDPGKELVSCRWDNNTGDHQCRVENGYDLNHNIEDHPTLEIPSVGNRSAGFYMCYVIPPGETEPHICKLTSIARVVRGTSPIPDERCETRLSVPLITAAIVFMALLIITILVVVSIVYRRQIQRFACRDSRQEDVEMAELNPLIPANQEHTECAAQVTCPHENTEIEDVVKDFRLDAEVYKRMMQLLERKMTDEHTKLFSIDAISLPRALARNDCLVVVLGSNTLKIVLVTLQGQNIDSSKMEIHTITTAIRQGSGEELFQFIASRINDFVGTLNLGGGTIPLLFVFSFPCKHERNTEQDLSRVQLARWTKGFDCRDILGQNLSQLLHTALGNNTVCDLDIKVIVNDVVDMLVSAVYKDASCKVAIVLEDGFNACYVQGENNAGSQSANNIAHSVWVYTTTEVGSFGDCRCLDLYLTDFDTDLDINSVNSREQIMEKMVSMLYIGELVRLVLVKLTQKKLLFKSVTQEGALYKADSFKQDFIPLVERDTDGNFQNTKFVLRMLEVVSYTDEDCATVQYVCRLISERAAYLAATVVAALVKHSGQSDVTVAVEESLYRSHPRFHQLLRAKTRELLNDEFQFNIKPFPNERGIGAALLAAAT